VFQHEETLRSKTNFERKTKIEQQLDGIHKYRSQVQQLATWR
jgi:hypothetical protein